MVRPLVLLLFFLSACGTPEPAPQDAGTGPPDVRQQRDAVVEVGDLGDYDAGRDVHTWRDADASAVDAGGFGEIRGRCGELDSELTSAEPHFFENSIDFGDDPYDEEDVDRLTDGSRRILSDGNENAGSILSEVFAYEVLARCEDAELLETERTIEYREMGKKTDLLVRLDGEKIGVSVTRAVGFPPDDPYTVDQATALLDEKLSDVLLSSANVEEADAWTKQILHVIAYAPGHAGSLATAWEDVDPATQADTIVWVTVTHGADEFLY